jgi:transposase
VTLKQCKCPQCQSLNVAAIPVGLENNGVFGESIRHLVTHARFSQAIGLKRLSVFCQEVFNFEISQGGIVNLLKSMGKALKPCVEAITKVVQQGQVIQSDETSLRVKGRTFWEWVFVCQEACLHILRDSRSQGAIGVVFSKESLEQNRPRVWVSDLYRGQGQGVADEWQVCLAHQLRDCDYAISMGDTVFAPVMIELFKNAIRLHHRRAELANSTFASYRSRVKGALEAALQQQPSTPEGRNLLRRYIEVKESLLTFLKYLDVPPTNNESEQRIRWSVVFRKVTNGSRSICAAELFMAYRSVVNTGAKHGLSALQSLKWALGSAPFFPVTPADSTLALNSS